MSYKEQAKAYLRRWEAVTEVEKKELRSSTFHNRLLQTLSLMGLGFSMAACNLTKIEEGADGIKKVRELWISLKKSC